MPSDTTEYIEITGSITAVIYANDDNGYAVLRLREALTGEEITVVGCIPGATDGETLTVYGIPEGTGYTVAEEDYSANGYETTSTGDSGEIVTGEERVVLC